MIKSLMKQIGINPNNLKTLDYNKIFSIYELAEKNSKFDEKPLILHGIVKEYFLKYEFPVYYDLYNNTSIFNSLEFINYLKATNSIVTPYEPINKKWDMARING